MRVAPVSGSRRCVSMFIAPPSSRECRCNGGPESFGTVKCTTATVFPVSAPARFTRHGAPRTFQRLTQTVVSGTQQPAFSVFALSSSLVQSPLFLLSHLASGTCLFVAERVE